VLVAGVLGVPAAQLESPGLDTLTSILTQPGEQARELQQALLGAVNSPDASASAAAADVAVGVVDQVAHSMASRAGLDVDTLFPMRRFMLQTVSRGGAVGAVAAPATSSSSSSSLIGSSESSIAAVAAGSNGSSESAVLQEAAQVALAAAGSSAVSTSSNGRVLRMRQL
jgi:hypothetical protein